MPRWLHSVLFTLTIVVLGVGILISPIGRYIEREFGLQWLFTLRGPVEAPPQVGVVGINGNSGTDLGLSRLPRNWPRSLHGALVDRLTASGAAGVVFDMDFSQSRGQIEDLTLADSVASSGNVILFERLDGHNERVVSGNNVTRWVWVETSEPPVTELASVARAVAPFPLPKIDKSSFQFWAFKPSADDSPTTAAVAAQMYLLTHHQDWRDLLGRAGVESSYLPPATALQAPGRLQEYMRGLRKLFLGKPFLGDQLRDLAQAAAMSPEGREAVQVLIALYSGPDEYFTNLYGPPGTIPTVSYQDMVSVDDLSEVGAHGDIKATETSRKLAGRIVFVGYSDLFSPDQPDRFHTVFTDERGIDLSGCEIMATAFANLVTGSPIRPFDPILSILLVAAFGVAICQIVFWPRAYLAVPLAIAAGGAYFYLAGQIFARESLWLPVATPVAVQLAMAVVAGLLGQYVIERRQKLRVGAELAQFLPAHLVEDLTKGRLDPGKINQVVHGVCLATDMSGFSSISERKSPGELARFMNDYFETIAAVLKSCKVDVTEFHADTIMCAWIGEPDDDEIRRRALTAAIEVVEAIEHFSAEDETVSLTARVGLQDGAFYLGHTGGGGRMTYSILGDPANSAARLEGLNKRLGTRVLAAGTVTQGLSGFDLRPLGEFMVVGKANVVPVVEVAGLAKGDPAVTDLHDGFAAGLAAFSREQWAAAAAAFESLASRFPEDRASRFYLEICNRYVKDGAPEKQAAILSMTEK